MQSCCVCQKYRSTDRRVPDYCNRKLSLEQSNYMFAAQGTSKTILKVTKFSWHCRWIIVICVVLVSFFPKCFFVQSEAVTLGTSTSTVIGGKRCCGNPFSSSLPEMVKESTTSKRTNWLAQSKFEMSCYMAFKSRAGAWISAKEGGIERHRRNAASAACTRAARRGGS